MTENIIVLLLLILGITLLVSAVVLLTIFYIVRYIKIQKIKKEEQYEEDNGEGTPDEL